MSDYEDLARLRIQAQDAVTERSRGEVVDVPMAGRQLVMKTSHIAGTYPTAPDRFFACTGQSVGGPEAEGASGSLMDIGTIYHVLNVGPNIPAYGTKIIAVYVPFRWIMEF